MIWRGLAFVTLVAAMVAGPIHNQVLGQHYHPIFKPWRMYYGFGTELCEVTFEQVAPDGASRVLDRYALLGYTPWTEAPRHVRDLPDGPTIGRVGQELCGALRGQAPDVRATARCASIRGWVPAMDGEVNLCRLGPRQLEGLRPRPEARR